MQECLVLLVNFHSEAVTMNCNMPTDPQFEKYYRKHLKCLKLNGLQPKTIEVYCQQRRQRYVTYREIHFFLAD